MLSKNTRTEQSYREQGAPIRILMLVSSDLDVDPRVQKEALSASQTGHSVTVYCRSAQKAYPYRVVAGSVARRQGTLAKLTERAALLLKGFQAAGVEKPDIVHANDLDMLPLGWVIARRYGARLLYDAHELWTDANRGVSDSIVKGAYYLERFLARRADAVVAVSDFRATAMAELLNIPKPHVVMNTPYYQALAELEPPPSLHAELGLPAGTRIVLYQGRYTDSRGMEEAILSAKYLPRDVVLVFRGYGASESNMRKLVSDENLSKRVFFVPPVSVTEVVRYAIGADIGLIQYKPVNRNNLYAAPNKLFEYMMAGVPMVAADLPYVRQIVLGEQIGLLFDPFDPVSIAKAINDMLDSPEDLAAMRERSLAAASRYSWEVEYQKLEAIYRELSTARG